MMVAMGLPASISDAAALSATIEHSGQCTALRVLVAPRGDASREAIEDMFEGTPVGGSASSYLKAGVFAGMLHPPPSAVPLVAQDGGQYSPPEGYEAHTSAPAQHTRSYCPSAHLSSPSTACVQALS